MMFCPGVPKINVKIFFNLFFVDVSLDFGGMKKKKKKKTPFNLDEMAEAVPVCT